MNKTVLSNTSWYNNAQESTPGIHRTKQALNSKRDVLLATSEIILNNSTLSSSGLLSKFEHLLMNFIFSFFISLYPIILNKTIMHLKHRLLNSTPITFQISQLELITLHKHRPLRKS